jgi:hypothetical protein
MKNCLSFNIRRKSSTQYSKSTNDLRGLEREEEEETTSEEDLTRLRYQCLTASVVDPNSFFSDSDPQIIFFGFGFGYGF